MHFNHGLENTMSDQHGPESGQVDRRWDMGMYKNFEPYASTVFVTLGLLLIIALGLLRLAAVGASPNTTFMILILGALAGWAAGMLTSPYSSDEKDRFISISQAISAFVSGYLLSKLDRLLESSLFKKDGALVSENWELVAFFTAAFMVFAVGTYTCRRYYKPLDDPARTNEAQGASAAQAGNAGAANLPVSETSGATSQQ